MLYALLGDALVRAKEQEQAVAILERGSRRLSGRRGAAAPARDGPRDGRPAARRPCRCSPPGWTPTRRTSEALFATLALLFEGFSRETAGAAAAEERQRLARYAKAYVDGKGPNREVIERWLQLPGVPRGRVAGPRASAPEDVLDPGPEAGRPHRVVEADALLALEPVVAGGAERPLEPEPPRRGERSPAGHALDRSCFVTFVQVIVGVADGIRTRDLMGHSQAL